MSTRSLVLAAVFGAVVAFAATAWTFAPHLNALEAKERTNAQELRSAREIQTEALAEAIALRAAHQAVSAARDELLRKREVQRVVTKQFGQRLVRRTATRLAREAGAAAPRSVPGAGAMVNAGMLALTLADACLTLRELAGVYAAFDEAHEQVLTVCGVPAGSASALQTSVPAR